MAVVCYLKHEVKVGDLLCRPAGVIVAHLKPGLHSLNVGALFEEVLIGAVVLQQVEQQQQTVLHHNTCTEGKRMYRTHVRTLYHKKNNNLIRFMNRKYKKCVCT